ncbi:MAG: HWE histidine kinase domain-containing protein [Cyanobacteria bacterium P01_A01_bin.114]
MSADSTQLQALALSNCHREPIHIIGNIQPFGALIATDRALEQITHVSANLASILGQTEWASADALGQALETVLPGQLIHNLRNVCGLSTIRSQRERLGIHELWGQRLEVAVHFNGAQTLIELEPLCSDQEYSNASVVNVKSILDQLPDSTAMLSLAVKELRNRTGFSRVMAYQFLQDGAGEVVAEARASDLEPYLGMRYPASDIPDQVRSLALKTTLRVIGDIHATPVPLLAWQETEKTPVDLTLTLLRGVSPVHLEYLTNMGVGASMNVAITIGGKLWGLFAFHHQQPKLISPDSRSTLDLFGQLFSLRFQQVLAEERFRDRRRAASTLDKIVTKQVPGSDWPATVTQAQPQLCKLLSAQGVAFASDRDLVSTHGEVPSETAIAALINHSQAQLESEIVTLESLRQINLPTVDSWGDSAGALLFALPSTQPFYLVFFRSETVKALRWGGNPEKKEVAYGEFGPRLRPRASFEEYTAMARGRCHSWSRRDLAVALEMRTELIRLAENRVQRFQQRQQNLLVAELNHRVRNILALIRSVTRQTHSSTDSIADYTQMLEQRIAALAAAHDLVAGHELEWPALSNLLAIELRPYLVDAQPRVRLIGPEVGFKANFVPTFVLVLHELASNAAKYGALSVPEGQLTVRWFETDGGVSFHWHESKGPSVEPPQRRGFGRDLIERAIPYEFEGDATLRFLSNGVEAEFWLPSELVRWQTEPDPEPVESPEPPSSEAPPQTHLGSVLVVEDNMLLVMDMENSLRKLGFEKIDAAPSVARALKCLDNNQYRVCVLDIDLKKETSFQIAQRLLEQQIPFTFTTGYDSKFSIPEELREAPLIKKPIEMAELEETLRQLIDL